MIEFHRLAEQELSRAHRWYSDRSSQAAEHFIRRVDEALSRVGAAAGTHEAIGRDYFAIRLKRFPYQLIYQVREGQIVRVIALAHSRRRTGYWRRRD